MLSWFWPSLADIRYALLGLLSLEAREGFVMVTIATHRRDAKNGFDAVAETYRHAKLTRIATLEGLTSKGSSSARDYVPWWRSASRSDCSRSP